MKREDPRNENRRRSDRGIVSKQLERLKDDARGRKFQRELLEVIRQERQARNAHDVVPLSAAPDARFLVAVTGEILVRSQQAGTAKAALAAADFHEQPVTQQRLAGKVARFVKAGADVKTATKVARDLRQQFGIKASINYVVPLGYVVKGEGGFEPTDVKDDYRGPGAAPGTGVQVAVIDTGVASRRRSDGWLENVVVDEDPAPDGNVDPVPTQAETQAGVSLGFATGHGQFVAGIVQQICPGADLRVYRAVDGDGIGSELAVADAVLRAVEDGARVINLSLGTETDGDVPPVALEVAMEAIPEDVLVVASAGNSASARPNWPSSFRRVISVASLTANGTPSAWSNHGPTVDCSIVGEGVVSTFVPGKESERVEKNTPDLFPLPGADESWALGTGTSYAAPQVSGLLAEELAKTPDAHQALLNVLTQQRLGPDSIPGYGVPLAGLAGTPA